MENRQKDYGIGEKCGLALITGASSGIGLELAKVHARHGGDLIILARREDRLNSLKHELETKHGCSVDVLVKDLSEPNSRREIFEYTQSRGVLPDYLINNAGIGGHGLFHKQDWHVIHKMIEVNITALTELTSLYLKPMVERGSGKILNVSSIAGFVPGPLQAVYFATKAYVLSLTEALSEELKDTGVTVTALCPGFTETEFGKAAGAEKIRGFRFAVKPDIVAEYGYQAMLSGKTVAVQGFSNKMLAHCALRLSPRAAATKISRFLMEKESKQ